MLQTRAVTTRGQHSWPYCCTDLGQQAGNGRATCPLPAGRASRDRDVTKGRTWDRGVGGEGRDPEGGSREEKEKNGLGEDPLYEEGINGNESRHEARESRKGRGKFKLFESQV